MGTILKQREFLKVLLRTLYINKKMKETIELVSAINHLLKILNDRLAIFEEINKLTNYKAFKDYAYQVSIQSKAFQKDLEKYSDETADEAGTSFLGNSKKLWLKLKENFTDFSLDSILEEAIKAEKSTLKAYDDVLNLPLPADLKKIISEQSLQIEKKYNLLILLDKDYSSDTDLF